MKWESELVNKNGRMVWEYGLKHNILIWLSSIVMILVGVSAAFMLNTFRWTI